MNDDIKVKFGNNVRKYRKIKGLSQEQLAALSKLHSTYISDLERGTRNISLETIQKLSNALDIEPYELFIF